MKKHYTLSALCVVYFLIFSINTATAQKTGSYDSSIQFNGQPRQLSVYAPTNYNGANSYRLMVCLHGLGDNSANYRNALINSLSWNTNIPNTIFICPESNTTNSDFYEGISGEQIIQTCIDYAKANYNIDPANVVLQGFSLGGRAALRYALDNPTKFKGVLLNTPAIQGVKESMNKSEQNYTFNFANASKVPIYITNGGTDQLYIAPIENITGQLILNDGVVKHLLFNSMGHTIPPFAQIADCISFFDAPGNSEYDADAVKIEIAERTCNSSVGAKCIVRNTGKKDLTSIQLEYSVDGIKEPVNWVGNLAPYQHAVVNLPLKNALDGSHTAEIKIITVNSSVSDSFLINNTQTKKFEVMTKGIAIPYVEGFEGANFPPQGWLQKPSGGFLGEWDEDQTVKKSGTKSATNFNTILIFDNSKTKNALLTPVLDFSSLPNPHVTFDVAYNFHRFTPPYTTQDVDFADTLEVAISTDCGNTFTTLFKRGGKDLATFGNPIINPININLSFINPADSNWQKIYIDLNNFATEKNAIISFEYISALGGSINIDNVNFGNNPVGINNNFTAEFTAYPNPANNMLYINANAEVREITLMDISGKTITPSIQQINGNYSQLDISTLAEGLYIVKVASEKGISTEKIIVSH